MNCIYCGSDNNRVYFTKKHPNHIYRGRKCNDCGKLFSTEERIKREGTRNILQKQSDRDLRKSLESKINVLTRALRALE